MKRQFPRSKGFGTKIKPKFQVNKPQYWLYVTEHDGNTRSVPIQSSLVTAIDQAKVIVANTNPPVDCVLLIDGRSDPENPKPGHVLGHFEPRPFVALGKKARLVK